MKRYAIVIEEGIDNLAAFVPDIPGCIATGRTEGEIKLLMQEALECHIELMKADAERIPEPGEVDFSHELDETTRVAYVEVEV